MKYTVNAFRAPFTLFLATMLLSSQTTWASPEAAGSLVPTISLLLNDESEPLSEFSCDFSITDLTPTANSSIAVNDNVSAQFSYTLSNRPAGVRVQVSPALITSLEDFDNFQSTSSLSLTPSLATLVDFETTESNISETIELTRTNDGTNIGLNGTTFNDLVVFVTLSRRDNESGVVTVIGSNTFDCVSRVSETVNWAFTR